MATIPTPEQGKPILDFSAGTFDGSSYLFQSRNGATEHVSGDDVADYVNTSRIYNGLDTTAKTPVGAINEINGKEAEDIPYDNTASGLTATDVQAALDEIIVLNKNAGYHNSIYRGKNLGNAVTEAQYTAINTGTFEDMYIGDYWVIHDDLTNKDITWRIAHFDYWLNCGDTNTITHHIVIIPDTILYSAKMNETNTTEGGYLHSKMRGGITYTDFSQGNLAQAKTIIETAFGSAHILSHRELLSSASDSSGATAWTWADSTVDLISEVMAYGCKVWANSAYDVGIDKEQLALFRHDHSRIANRSHQWLRSVSSSAAFASVHYNGHASDSIASYSGGVRPAFALCS